MLFRPDIILKQVYTTYMAISNNGLFIPPICQNPSSRGPEADPSFSESLMKISWTPSR